MKLEAIGRPFTYQWPGGQIRFELGRVIDVPEDRALRIMAKVPGRVRPLQDASLTPPLKPGVWVEWLSPALPRQQGEVLAIDGDRFEVYHPLTEILCRLPISWITRVVTTVPTQQEPTP